MRGVWVRVVRVKSAVKIFKLLVLHLNKSLIRKQQMLFKQGKRKMK